MCAIGAYCTLLDNLYISVNVLTLWRPLGHRWPTRIDLWTDPISPRRRRVSAGLHAADTVACVHRFFHILGRPCEPAVWFMSESRAVINELARKICGSTDHFQQFWNGYGRQRVIQCFVDHAQYPFDALWVTGDPRELTSELTRFRRVAGASPLACTQQTHCGMRASIFSHTRTTMRAGSLVYVRVESGHKRASEENMRINQLFPAVLKWLRSSKG